MITLTPAYGRDYKSAKAVKADWQAGKDFIIADWNFHRYSGKPANRSDLEGQKIMIRYAKLRKVVVL